MSDGILWNAGRLFCYRDDKIVVFRKTVQKQIGRKLTACLIVVMMLMTCSFSVWAQENDTDHDHVVKVGYLLIPGFQEGTDGEYKTGQGYEYLQKIASYTGWTYEYVYGTFTELYNQLAAGEIDIMGNMSYTKERAEIISYSQNEEGKEAFYLYVNGTYSSISSNDFSSINGKKIGVSKDTYQKNVWTEWCKENTINCHLIEYDSDTEREEALNSGAIDATIDVLLLSRTAATSKWRSVLKFCDAPYYFGVNQNKPDLLAELNEAQTRILNENPYYNEELSNRYLQTDNLPSKQFTDSEVQWLEEHQNHIIVGCLEGSLPLGAVSDGDDVKGVLPDLVKMMQESYADYGLKFDTVLYSDYSQMIADLKEGVIDVATPVFGDYWNADQEGICLTDPVLSTTMLLLHQGSYIPGEIHRIGVDEKSPLQIAVRKAETDPMTGLLNKVAMREQIKEQLPQGGILFMIDFDNFKLVNDILGHKTGDQVLTQFASNLGSIFRSGDVIGRFGGDEFMVFLPKSAASDEMIEKKIIQMQQELTSYHLSSRDPRVNCSVSAGVVRIKPNASIGYTEAFEKADAALYEAKNKGKNTYVIVE